MITAALRSATLNDRPFVRHEPLAHPFVSIVVPVYNNADGVAELLRALAKQSYPADSFECLLVDNGSDPPLQAPADPGFECRVLREPRPGSYAARNCGVAEARGSLIAFTDSDCLPEPEWLEQGIEALNAFEGPGMIGGRIRIVCRDAGRPSAFELLNVITGFPQEQYITEFHFGATANVICHRELFVKVGLFDATMYSAGDNHWGKRVHAAGFLQHYSSAAAVAHPALADASQFWRKYRRIAGGMYRMRRQAGWSMPRLLGHLVAACTRRWFVARRDDRCRNWRDQCRLAYACAAQFAMLTYECTRLWCGGKPRRC